jgi:preprotein translocase subunit SecA
VTNKRYPDLLHRAVEVKEGLEPAPLTMIYNTITMQDFLQLYGTLCGMTGTAAASAKEMEAIYGLTVDIIPPHTPSVRIDHEDAILGGKSGFIAASSHRSGIAIKGNSPRSSGRKAWRNPNCFPNCSTGKTFPMRCSTRRMTRKKPG